MPFPESFNDGPIPSSSKKGGRDEGLFAGGPELFQSGLPECLFRSHRLLDKNKQPGYETYKHVIQTYIDSKKE